MRTTNRWMAAALLAGAAATAGCDAGTRSQGGDPDVQGPGYAQDEERGTILNDTAPARPEAPVLPPATEEHAEGEPPQGPPVP